MGLNPAAMRRVPSNTGSRAVNCTRGSLTSLAMPASLTALTSHSTKVSATVSSFAAAVA